MRRRRNRICVRRTCLFIFPCEEEVNYCDFSCIPSWIYKRANCAPHLPSFLQPPPFVEMKLEKKETQKLSYAFQCMNLLFFWGMCDCKKYHFKVSRFFLLLKRFKFCSNSASKILTKINFTVRGNLSSVAFTHTRGKRKKELGWQ